MVTSDSAEVLSPAQSIDREAGLDRRPVEAFILFNERENIVEKIVGELSSHGISTYFWRRDFPAGAEWREVETEQLRTAGVVVVFLGDHGWGPNHLPIQKRLSDCRSV
jgi:hypothetical protein